MVSLIIKDEANLKTMKCFIFLSKSNYLTKLQTKENKTNQINYHSSQRDSAQNPTLSSSYLNEKWWLTAHQFPVVTPNHMGMEIQSFIWLVLLLLHEKPLELISSGRNRYMEVWRNKQIQTGLPPTPTPPPPRWGRANSALQLDSRRKPAWYDNQFHVATLCSTWSEYPEIAKRFAYRNCEFNSERQSWKMHLCWATLTQRAAKHKKGVMSHKRS